MAVGAKIGRTNASERGQHIQRTIVRDSPTRLKGIHNGNGQWDKKTAHTFFWPQYPGMDRILNIKTDSIEMWSGKSKI